MLIRLDGTDITNIINDTTYVMDAIPQYEEWKDGNYVTHRIEVRRRITGKFQVALYGRDNIDTEAFLEMLDNATENGVTTLGVYVTNRHEFKAINAYVETTTEKHALLENGDYFDLINVVVEER